MKKLYDWFIESGQDDRAKEILNIPRYADFDKDTSKEKEPGKKTKSEKVK